MTRLSRTLVFSLALLTSLPPAFSAPTIPLSAPDQFPMGPAEEAPVFVPQPLSEDISEELRLMMEDGDLVAANRPGRKIIKRKTKKPSKSSVAPSRSSRRSTDSRLGRARQLAAAGKYAEASKMLFPLSRNPQFQKDSTQIRYILGLMLYEMKLYQSAAFVFYDVVRQESKNGASSRYLKQALEKLSLSADALDSDVLLKYAIKKVDENEFPAAHRDMLYFRTGEIRMADKNYAEASRFFGRVKSSSPFFAKSKYNQALSLALSAGGDKANLSQAQRAFDDLIAMSEKGGVTNVNRVSALIGRARVLYQRQEWDAALEAYREVPRDTEQWHSALFESTWANLRSARFRSALSNFHSLHSDYYEDFYQPESLILRAIVYVYICRYDEMEKVLGLFDRVYKPVRRDVANLLKANRDPLSLYRDISRVRTEFEGMRKSRNHRKGLQIPFLVARHIMKEGDVRRGMNYISRLEEEKKRIESMPGSWNRSAVGMYAKKVVERRMRATQMFVGKLVKHHLNDIGRELLDLSEQKDLLVVETLSGKRETIKKEIAGKGISKAKIQESTERDFLIQNGFEYWPFKGEYWLDEIGNYHYVGVQACE